MSINPLQDKTPGKVILIAAVAALGGLLFGFDSAVINGTVSAIREDFNLGPALLGFTVSCALLGAMVGAWVSGPLADNIGRTRSMIIASVLFTVSALGSGLAFGVTDLIIWRAVGGIGVGMASVLAPAYIAEISPAHSRGRLGSLQQLAIVTGIFLALLASAFLAGIAGGANEVLWFGLDAWRWMFLAELVPAVAYGLLALAIPESPRYLVAKDQLTNAAQILRDVVGVRGKDAAEKRIAEIKGSLNLENRQSLRDLRGTAAGLKPIVWIGIGLSVFQQFVGINVIFYYSTTLWQSVGFTESDSLTITVLTSVTNIVVTVVAILLVDRIGRKILLLVGSAGMFVSLATMAISFSQAIVEVAADGTQDVSLPQPWSMIALIAANLFVVSFGATWGPMVWVLLGEMFPNRIRALALGVAAAAQWLANFAVSQTFPALANVGLPVAYGLYAFFAFVSFLFVWKFIRETKGMQLEDMQEESYARRDR